MQEAPTGQLDGKRIVATGASRGVGKAMEQALSVEGVARSAAPEESWALHTRLW